MFGALVGAVSGAYAEAAANAEATLIQAGRVAAGRAVQIGGTVSAEVGASKAIDTATKAASGK